MLEVYFEEKEEEEKQRGIGCRIRSHGGALVHANHGIGPNTPRVSPIPKTE